MKVIAAYLLAKLGGNENPLADDLKKILGLVGADSNDGRVELFLSLIKDQDITELIAVGRQKMAAFSSLGAGMAVAAGTCGGGGSSVGGEAAPATAKEKEEKEQLKEESDEETMFSLFD